MLSRYPIEFISERFAAAGQISPTDLDKLVEMGFKTILNNRPDLEEPNQPLNQDIEAAALEKQLAYFFYPIDETTFHTIADVEKYAQFLSQLKPPVLAFCRVGARVAYAYRLIEHYTPQILSEWENSNHP